MSIWNSLPLLLINNVGYVIDALLALFLIGLVYVNDRRNPINRMFMLALFTVVIFLVSQVIGVNISDPHLSKLVLMWNTCNLFLSCFIAHFVFLFLGKEKEQKPVLIVFYTVSMVLFLVYMFFPDTFLLDSVPKLYFLNYFVAGSLDWVMRLWSNAIIPLYFIIVMIFSYRKADADLKNRLRYVFVGIVSGYALGSTAIPLIFTTNPTVFGIYFDPVYSILCMPLLTVPVVYAILKYNLFDIKIVAKRAFIYGLFVVVVGMFITLLDFSNQIILSNYPNFPLWILPLISSVIAVSIGFLVWGKLREYEAIKSEFITVVTHKFRTPLTQIRWATETLSVDLSQEDKNNVIEIERASNHLIDLTNLLVQLSDTDGLEYDYQMRPMRLDALVDDMKIEYRRRAQLKNIEITFSGSSNKNIYADEAQIRFVVQTLLDNAISYTAERGKIAVKIYEESAGKKKKDMIVFSVTDSGIGLSKEQGNKIFEKFWRSPEARKVDTEGMGIGLFMARRTIERQEGSLRVHSDGLGKGCTFFMKLPVKLPSTR